MRKIYFILLLSSFSALCGPMEDWDLFEKQIRDQTISKDSAHHLFPAIYDSLLIFSSRFSFARQSPWIFPVQGYSIRDAGKDSFKPDIYYGGSSIKGYDFFDGNRHGGHPAYDIFIHDKNRDYLDDKTGKQVYVVAPCDMVILSANTLWQKGSDIRGGNYIWALAPQSGELLYFAHMDSVLVSKGTFVRSHERIGTVGRTGKNAARKESATHLHMMVLQVSKYGITPVDFIKYFSGKSDK
jgi:peptidoglycan LD-endopeptidase LytH